MRHVKFAGRKFDGHAFRADPRFAKLCARIGLVGLGGNDWATALALQPDGRILVAGESGLQVNSNFSIVRYTSAGAVDTTFGTGGVFTFDFPARHDDRPETRGGVLYRHRPAPGPGAGAIARG